MQQNDSLLRAYGVIRACGLSAAKRRGATDMTEVVTADQFVTGVLAELCLQGKREIKLADTWADGRFETAFELLLARAAEFDVEPDFSLLTNPFHGDSETLRETLYAIRERGVVAINNPSLKTVEIKLCSAEAEEHLNRSPLPRNFFSEVVRSYFEGDNRASTGTVGKTA